MMENLVLIMIGLCMSVIGILNICGNIRSVHWYNRTRITEETRRPYGRAIGVGTILIGASMCISAILEWCLSDPSAYWAVLVGCILGLTCILYGQFKYNKGLF